MTSESISSENDDEEENSSRKDSRPKTRRGRVQQEENEDKSRSTPVKESTREIWRPSSESDHYETTRTDRSKEDSPFQNWYANTNDHPDQDD